MDKESLEICERVFENNELLYNHARSELKISHGKAVIYCVDLCNSDGIVPDVSSYVIYADYAHRRDGAFPPKQYGA